MYKRQVEEIAEDDEDCGQLMGEIFEDMDCCSNVNTVDCYRIGKKETAKTRPIRIECKDRSDAQYYLFHARKLKKSEKFSKVYLAPDRTREQRIAHNKLVKQMKEKIAADPGKYFYIRNKMICSIDKTERAEH